MIANAAIGQTMTKAVVELDNSLKNPEDFEWMTTFSRVSTLALMWSMSLLSLLTALLIASSTISA